MHVVEADHGDISRDPDPGRLQLADGPDRHLIVAADDRIWQLPARPGQDLAHGQLAADSSEPALEEPCHGRPRVLGYRLFERAAPFPRVRGFRRARDVKQPRPAVLLDHMADRRLRARAVIGADNVDVQFVGIGGDQRDRDACRQQRQLL